MMAAEVFKKVRLPGRKSPQRSRLLEFLEFLDNVLEICDEYLTILDDISILSCDPDLYYFLPAKDFSTAFAQFITQHSNSWKNSDILLDTRTTAALTEYFLDYYY
jgi:hypothetical protein